MSERTASKAARPERLSARRRRRRRRIRIALAILALILLGVVFWALWQPALRIQHVRVEGLPPSAVHYGEDAMKGTYLGIFPRNSTVFVPSATIRAHILADHPEVAAVSIFHTGIQSILLRATDRTAIATWCGLAPTPGVAPYCYVFDPNGFVFAALPTTVGSTTPPSTVPAALQPVNPFVLYAALQGGTQEPLRATIVSAQKLPSVFDFARQLSTFGSPVRTIQLHGGEVDMVLASGTRITYVLGTESASFSALLSAKNQFSLSDGSVAYVDLRFPGKVYVKHGTSAPAAATSSPPHP